MTAAWLVTLTIGFGLGFFTGGAVIVWLVTGPEENLPSDADPVRLWWREYDEDDAA